jgi:TolB-like protein
MKIYQFLISILFIISISPAQDKPNVAVLELEAKGISEHEASTLSDILRSEIKKQDVFRVLERGQVDEVLKEQGFQQTGCTSSECYVEMGQLIGVEKLITGSIGKLGEAFIVSVRMLDVKTGEIVKDETVKFEGKIEKIMDETIPDIARTICSEKVPVEAKRVTQPIPKPIAPKPKKEIAAKAPSEEKKKPVNVKKIVRVSLLSAGAISGLIAYYSYRRADGIYVNKYQKTTVPAEAVQYREEVKDIGRRANILIGLSGVFFIGGVITFAF